MNLNFDKDVFHHESDRYQQYQNLEHSQTLRAVELQKNEMNKKRENEKYVKQI